MPRNRDAKPPKPYPEFPLTAHPNGQWCKKVRGTLRYFGAWDDWEAALALYRAQRDDLHAGREPGPAARPGGATVDDVCEAFLAAKSAAVGTGELSRATFRDYERACDLIDAHFGAARAAASIGPADWAKFRARLAQGRGLVRLNNLVNHVRIVFKFAHDARLVPNPPDYGKAFSRPDRRALRRSRAASGPKTISADEFLAVVAVARVPVRAMAWLGLNCGFGNTDCATLARGSLDLDRGWVDHARPKTGVARRCPLWPETVAALRAALAARPRPTDPADADLAFVTKYGGRWVRVSETGSWNDRVGQEWAKACATAGVGGRGFYSLRHTFRTVADGAGDQQAASAIMGHAPDPDDMRAVYVDSVSDDRLRAVADRVRASLFARTAAM